MSITCSNISRSLEAFFSVQLSDDGASRPVLCAAVFSGADPRHRSQLSFESVATRMASWPLRASYLNIWRCFIARTSATAATTTAGQRVRRDCQVRRYVTAFAVAEVAKRFNINREFFFAVAVKHRASSFSALTLFGWHATGLWNISHLYSNVFFAILLEVTWPTQPSIPLGR